MLYPTLYCVKKLHDYILKSLGGEPGIINESNLESAVERPSTFTYGFTPFKDVISKAAVLGFAIITWHPFIDGNKRTAVYVIEDMLEANGYYIAIPPYMVRYTVLAALEPSSPGSISESEFTIKIAKLCSSNRLTNLFKRIRYEALPGLWLRWSFFWAEKLMKGYNEIQDHPDKVPKFAVNLYQRFSKIEFIKLLYNIPIDWLAAGDLNIFLLTLHDHAKWESEGFPKDIPFPLVEDKDYVEME